MNMIYEQYLASNKKDILIICIGTPRRIGDSLGPLVGTRLLKMNNINCKILGSLDDPVHGANYQHYYKYIDQDKYFIIAIDAALGNNIKEISYTYQIFPGNGVNKNLPGIGDIGIIGVVANQNTYEDNYLNITFVSPKLIFEVSNKIIEARLLSMSWQIGSVISTRLSKNDCKSTKKSCLKRVIFEASGTLVKPQNSLRCLENAERLAKEILLE